MGGISSLGVGSGVLNADLVDRLVEAERGPAKTRLDQEQKETEAMISAFGKIRSAVTDLRLPMRQLGSPEAMQSYSASTNGDSVSVSVDSANASEGNYSLDVQQLATNQSLASGSFSDRNTTSVGEGTLTIQTGDNTTNITVDGSNDTLQGLANSINESDAGVSAGIVDTGNGYRLTLSSDESGTANGATISVADSDGNDTDNAGLSQFAFNDTTKNMEETVAAQDAKLSVNGIDVTRSSNSVEGVVDGLTFQLQETGTTSVGVSQDTGAVAEKVQKFVDKFNAFKSTVNELTSFSQDSGGSLLTGDATVRNVENQLKRELNQIVPGLENASVRSLSDVGISTDFQTGQLEFDSQKFQEELKANPDDVTALFAEQGRTSDSQVEFVRSSVNTEAGEYSINVSQAATQGQLVSSNQTPATGINVDADNNSLTFKVDGQTSASIELTAGTYTRQELATEIQTQLNKNDALNSADRSVNVGVDGSGSLTFTSGSYGSDSNVAITSVDTNTEAEFGLAVETGTTGNDVAGTINGATAEGDGRVLRLSDSSDNAADGIQVRINGSQTGDRGTVEFIQGVSERMVDTVSNMVGSNGALSSRTDALNNELDDIAQEREDLNERIQSYRERLTSQFSSADARIAEFNSTQQYLSQQLAGMSGGSGMIGGG
ncbi:MULTISPECIES: flagellar filament capping protein FliD [Halomonadaceae]|uniref:Flagellar hook-associated protein 2 n=1 Tax=Vreelandella halophila TaxID=86177 RepID=A0A9X4YAQ9_9GAMM|nr:MULTISPECIES: flagellar filament capping protein FliD [Halomonas]MYL26297.1 flagellar filament capping protein FliD [Halomonas utahensis]MYL73634.1 flagellar filament capping protein FliD [Halomonas sp. 22501_18_FS]